jgi:hypothetical protein
MIAQRPPVEPENVPERADEGAASAAPPDRPGGRRRLRGWLAAILVVLACVFALITAVLFWSHGLLMNTDNFVGVVGPILKDPKVTRNVGTFVAEKAITVTDVEGRIHDVLPADIKFLAGPLTAQLQEQVSKEMVRLLRSDTVYNLWIRINTYTHEQALAMLRGETKVMRIEGDKIILDLVPLIAIGIQELDKIIPGMLGQKIDLPKIDVKATPAEQRAQLSEALGTTLSPTFGQVTLVQSAQVKTAQTAVKWFDLVIWVLLAVTLVLAAVAVAVSPRRLRTLIQLGLGAVVVVVIVMVVIGQLKGWLADSIKVKGLVPVINDAVGSIFASLKDALVWLLATGAAIAVVAYLAGRPRWVMRSLGWLSRTAHAGAAEAGRARGPVSTWVQAHLTGLQVGGLVAAIVILFFASSSLGWSIAIVALLVVYQIALLLLDGRRPEWLPGGGA